MRLIQIRNSRLRKTALVDGSQLRLLGASTLYDLALAAIEAGKPMAEACHQALTDERLDYDAVYEGRSDWQLLPSFDHPADPAHCLVSGTGLTHKKSAENRSAMHVSSTAPVTDSMRMYQWGVEGGFPSGNEIGAQPEWFYKGDGTVLRAHGDPLPVPVFAEDGGEEPEIAGVYVIARNGTPHRVGWTGGNEFSDHKMERRNYLYLAHSKLRACATGPELVVSEPFPDDLAGTVRVAREGKVLWEKPVHSGQANMCHSLANLEHHHFKYPGHCRPGDVHIHFFGADAFSFGEGIELRNGDVMEVSFPALGRPLRNPLSSSGGMPQLVTVKAL